MAPPYVQASGRFLVISTKLAFRGVRDLCFFVTLQMAVTKHPVAALRGNCFMHGVIGHRSRQKFLNI